MNDNSALRMTLLYTGLASLFSVIAVLSNLITVKLFQAPFHQHLAIPAGILTYPLTFLIGDLVTEIFGEKKARFMVYLGFFANMAAYGIIFCAILLPPHPLTNQQAFEWAFGLSGIAVIGSIFAYLVGQILDIQIFSALKKITQGRHLWLRNNGSTLISQLVDTVLVNGIYCTFALGLKPDAVLKIIFISYLYKGAVTIANTPLFYLAVFLSKKTIYRNEPAMI